MQGAPRRRHPQLLGSPIWTIPDSPVDCCSSLSSSWELPSKPGQGGPIVQEAFPKSSPRKLSSAPASRARSGSWRCHSSSELGGTRMAQGRVRGPQRAGGLSPPGAGRQAEMLRQAKRKEGPQTAHRAALRVGPARSKGLQDGSEPHRLCNSNHQLRIRILILESFVCLFWQEIC